jgi:hypothetical protein
MRFLIQYHVHNTESMDGPLWESLTCMDEWATSKSVMPDGHRTITWWFCRDAYALTIRHRMPGVSLRTFLHSLTLNDISRLVSDVHVVVRYLLRCLYMYATDPLV